MAKACLLTDNKPVVLIRQPDGHIDVAVIYQDKFGGEHLDIVRTNTLSQDIDWKPIPEVLRDMPFSSKNRDYFQWALGREPLSPEVPINLPGVTRPPTSAPVMDPAFEQDYEQIVAVLRQLGYSSTAIESFRQAFKANVSTPPPPLMPETRTLRMRHWHDQFWLVIHPQGWSLVSILDQDVTISDIDVNTYLRRDIERFIQTHSFFSPEVAMAMAEYANDVPNIRIYSQRIQILRTLVEKLGDVLS